jgi:hypothetical protein
MKKLLFLLLLSIMFISCSENYSNGERVGYVTKFSEKGLLFKSHEGELNLSQTGMNSAGVFEFSIDNDNVPTEVVKTLDSAQRTGDRVKLIYHETIGWNWFGNRGDTNHFVTTCEILTNKPVIKDSIKN